MARTLMWRTIVAMVRGGNLCGAMWQRPQLVRNLFSPSIRLALSSVRTVGAALIEVWLASAAAGVVVLVADATAATWTAGAVSAELALARGQHAAGKPHY